MENHVAMQSTSNISAVPECTNVHCWPNNLPDQDQGKDIMPVDEPDNQQFNHRLQSGQIAESLHANIDACLD